jgi:hypothetical protein
VIVKIVHGVLGRIKLVFRWKNNANNAPKDLKALVMLKMLLLNVNHANQVITNPKKEEILATSFLLGRITTAFFVILQHFVPGVRFVQETQPVKDLANQEVMRLTKDWFHVYHVHQERMKMREVQKNVKPVLKGNTKIWLVMKLVWIVR